VPLRPESNLPTAPRWTNHHGSVRAWCHLLVQYHGIDRCDRCGQPLEDGQWLSGLCRVCEEAVRKPTRPVEVVTSRRALL